MLRGEIESIVIGSGEPDMRLDKILANRFPEQSRTYFQMLIEKGLVKLNGRPVKKKDKPRIGDKVEIEFALTPEINLDPENIPLDILYEDDHLLAVNKPAGMVVHPAPGHWSGTFVNALLYHCKWEKEVLQDSLRPGIVHRLDKETSGALLAAKTSLAHQRLVGLFSERRIAKTYLAICIGKPHDGLIMEPIGRHPTKRKEMQIQPEGRPSETDIKVLGWNDKLSCVQAKPKTGRTHQIRVHLQYAGAPILGDGVYGSQQANKRYDVHRHMLHAWQIAFYHPITGKPLTIKAPIPADFMQVMNKIDPKIYLE